jgi:carboxypeptidase C (cathepsin A)
MNTSNQHLIFIVTIVCLCSFISSKSRIERIGVTTLPHYQGGKQSKSFTGYLQVRPEVNGHLFFWLFESSSLEPENEPLILWLNGGNS